MKTVDLTPVCGCRNCRHWTGIHVFVSPGTEPGRTDSEKNEILITQAGDALAASGWNEYDVAWSNSLPGKVADLYLARAGQNDIALCRSSKAVPPGSDTRTNASPRDRYPWIRVAVRELVDMAAFGCVELGLRYHRSYFFVHAGSRVAGNLRGRGSASLIGEPVATSERAEFIFVAQLTLR